MMLSSGDDGVCASGSGDLITVSPGTAVLTTQKVTDSEPLKATRIVFDFPAHHRRLLQIVTAVILAILMVEWIYLTTQRPEPLPIQRGQHFQSQFQVEINSATWVEWLQLEGIGPALAHRIVADRRLNGPFESIDHLTRVPGIGQTTLDRIRGCLTIRHDLSDTRISEPGGDQRSGRRRANQQRKPTAI